MTRWMGAFSLAAFVAASGFSAGQGPEVEKVDQKISINVEGITLGRLLQLWDQATGMQSSVPADLANRTLSVHFSGLTVNDAVRKIFEREAIDYVFVEGKGIMVTTASLSASEAESAPAYEQSTEVVTERSVQESPQVLIPPPEQPRPLVMWTPFGPIVQSRANPIVQLPPVPGEPPPPPFFKPAWPPPPPAGAPNGPVQNSLFVPISIHP